MIRVGTSGYSYDDWHGPFYPDSLAPAERLGWYARFFDTVEINSTFYRQPSPRLATGWLAKVPAGFTFAVKVYGGITHDDTAATDADLARFAAGVAPLAEAGALACVLAQFPNRFQPTRAHVDFVRRLREAWPQLPLVVEFRHERWHDERAFEFLTRWGLGYCNVDEPELPGLLPVSEQVTAPLAYVRFHGRNAARWYRHEEAWQRYDYLYRGDELGEWVERLKRIAERADSLYVYFNNHYVAQAVTNARELLDLLGVVPGDEPETVDVHR